MKSNRILLLCVVLAVAAGCGGGGGGGSSSGAPPAPPPAPPLSAFPMGLPFRWCPATTCSPSPLTARNVRPATVAQWPNKPCVSVTICDPGNPASCQVINDITLDTGDYGLRIFQQTLSPGLVTAFNLNQVRSGALPVYECTEYGDGSAVWGPVQRANVILGAEPAVTVPIQVIGSSAGNPSQVCAGHPTLSDPTTALYNGSLGLGPFVQDCGDPCAASSNGKYFTCSGGTCTRNYGPPRRTRSRTRSRAFPSTITASAYCSPASLPADHPRLPAISCSASAPGRITAPPGLSRTAPTPKRELHHGLQRRLLPWLSRLGLQRPLLPRQRDPDMQRLVLPPVHSHPLGHDHGFGRLPERQRPVPDRRTSTPSSPLRTTYSLTSARPFRACSTGGSPFFSEETCM